MSKVLYGCVRVRSHESGHWVQLSSHCEQNMHQFKVSSQYVWMDVILWKQSCHQDSKPARWTLNGVVSDAMFHSSRWFLSSRYICEPRNKVTAGMQRQRLEVRFLQNRNKSSVKKWVLHTWTLGLFHPWYSLFFTHPCYLTLPAHWYFWPMRAQWLLSHAMQLETHTGLKLVRDQ